MSVLARAPDAGATFQLVPASRFTLEQLTHPSRLTLSHLALHTVEGVAAAVGRTLFAHLYHRHPDRETYTENIPASDPHLPAFLDLGHAESFRRIEMRRVEAVAGKL